MIFLKTSLLAVSSSGDGGRGGGGGRATGSAAMMWSHSPTTAATALFIFAVVLLPVQLTLASRDTLERLSRALLALEDMVSAPQSASGCAGCCGGSGYHTWSGADTDGGERGAGRVATPEVPLTLDRLRRDVRELLQQGVNSRDLLKAMVWEFYAMNSFPPPEIETSSESAFEDFYNNMHSHLQRLPGLEWSTVQSRSRDIIKNSYSEQDSQSRTERKPEVEPLPGRYSGRWSHRIGLYDPRPSRDNQQVTVADAAGLPVAATSAGGEHQQQQRTPPQTTRHLPQHRLLPSSNFGGEPESNSRLLSPPSSSTSAITGHMDSSEVLIKSGIRPPNDRDHIARREIGRAVFGAGQTAHHASPKGLFRPHPQQSSSLRRVELPLADSSSSNENDYDAMNDNSDSKPSQQRRWNHNLNHGRGSSSTVQFPSKPVWVPLQEPLEVIIVDPAVARMGLAQRRKWKLHRQTVTLTPSSGVFDVLRQAALQSELSSGGSIRERNPFRFRLGRFRSKCYMLEAVMGKEAENGHYWLLTVKDTNDEVIFNDVCIPNKQHVAMRPGYKIYLTYGSLPAHRLL